MKENKLKLIILVSPLKIIFSYYLIISFGNSTSNILNFFNYNNIFTLVPLPNSLSIFIFPP